MRARAIDFPSDFRLPAKFTFSCDLLEFATWAMHLFESSSSCGSYTSYLV